MDLWFYQDIFDYKGMLFKKEYKSLGMLVLPLGIFRIFITVFLFPLSMLLLAMPLLKWLEKITVIGFNVGIDWNIDWFFVNITQIQIFSVIGVVFTFVTLWVGRGLVNDRKKFTIDIFYMLFMYTFIAPIWLIKSSYNALFAKKE